MKEITKNKEISEIFEKESQMLGHGKLGKFLEKVIEFKELKRIQTLHNMVMKSRILQSLFLLSGL